MNVDGSWDLVIDSPMGKQNVIITLKEDAERLTGRRALRPVRLLQVGVGERAFVKPSTA
jgi:hypothetical protein